MLRCAVLLCALATPLLAQSEGPAPRVPAKYHYRQDSPERIKIEETLDTKLAHGIVLEGDPQQLMAAIGEHFGIITAVDEDALANEGISDSSSPKLELPTGVTLRQALDTVFEELEAQLDVIVRSDTLELTSRALADDFVETVVYELRDLPSEAADEPREMVSLILNHFDGWQEFGGEGTVAFIPGGLVVQQSQRQHRQILACLQQLRAFNTGPPLTISVSNQTETPPYQEFLTSEEKNIFEILNGPPPTGLEEVTNLDELCRRLQEACPFPVRLDRSALENEGIGAETTVRVRRLNRLQNSLDSALRSVGGIKLVVFVRHAGITITTSSRAKQKMYLQIYPFSDLHETLRTDMTYLAELFRIANLKNFVDQGLPPGSLTSYPGCMLYTGSYEAHAEMRSVFLQLREFSAQQGYPEPVVPVQEDFHNPGLGFGRESLQQGFF